MSQPSTSHLPASPPVARPGLATEGLSFARPGAPPILSDLDAHFPPGRLSALTGPSGVGKSTLLHLLAGLLRPTAGQITAEGEPISRWLAGHRDRWRRQLGLSLQRPHLLPELTVRENLMLPAVPLGLPPAALRARADAALAALDLSALAPRPARTLSGGEAQRVALARALTGAPRYLLADEPTAHQDDAACARILAALTAARDRGAVVIVASHDPRLTRVADHRLPLG